MSHRLPSNLAWPKSAARRSVFVKADIAIVTFELTLGLPHSLYDFLPYIEKTTFGIACDAMANFRVGLHHLFAEVVG